MDSHDKVNWKHLGYPDMGDLLKNLASDEESERNAAYDNLIVRRLLYSINSLTLYFVPYFISLLKKSEVKGKGDLIIPLTDWTAECKRVGANEFHEKY